MTDTAATPENSQPGTEAIQQDLETPVVALLPEVAPEAAASADPDSAGAVLKRLREQTGWSMESLSGALKVPVKTLQALENNDLTGLPDLVFSRALAASVCRTLKVDAAQVLALMPQIVRSAENVKPEAILNVPMGRSVDFSGPMGWLKTKSAALVALIVLGIVVLSNWPTLTVWWNNTRAESAPAAMAALQPNVGPTDNAAVQMSPSTTNGAAAGTEGLKTVVTEVLPITQTGVGVASDAVGSAVVGGALSSPMINVVVQVSAPSWIEITDNGGKTLWSRLLDQSAPVQLTVPAGARMAVGNAAATRLSVNGKSVDLGAVTNANIARLELK